MNGRSGLIQLALVMIDLVRWIALLLLATLACGKQEADSVEQAPRKIYRQQSQQMRVEQIARRNAAGIEKTYSKSYNFKLNNSSEFILQPSEDQEIKIVFDVYWNQNNVYVQAAVVQGEAITVTLEHMDGGGIFHQEQFYTAAGVTFNASAGKKYRIKTTQNGSYPKLVMMQLAETMIPSNNTAKKDEMAKVHAKLLVAKIKLDNGLKVAQRELMVQNQISKQILHQSYSYAYFEIVEAFLISVFAFVEVKLVINLLKTDSII